MLRSVAIRVLPQEYVNPRSFSNMMLRIYCFAIAVRDTKKYENKIVPLLDFEMGGASFGSSLKGRMSESLIR